MIVAALSSMAPALVVAKSCYEHPLTTALKPYERNAGGIEVFVLIDLTVDYPKDVIDQVLSEAQRASVDGVRINVGSFSNYSANTYSKLITTVSFEGTISDVYRRKVRRDTLALLEACLFRSRQTSINLLQSALTSQFHLSNSKLEQSNVLTMLQQFSPRVLSSKARQKKVFIVSDMIENSPGFSFYAKGTLRSIDVKVEFEKAQKRNMMANWSGVEIYVFGLGLPSGNHKNVIQSIESIGRLESFWRLYFSNSKAARIAIGRPMLIEQVQ